MADDIRFEVLLAEAFYNDHATLEAELEKLLTTIRELDAAVSRTHEELCNDIRTFVNTVTLSGREEQLSSIHAKMNSCLLRNQERSVIAYAADKLIQSHLAVSNARLDYLCSDENRVSYDTRPDGLEFPYILDPGSPKKRRREATPVSRPSPVGVRAARKPPRKREESEKAELMDDPFDPLINDEGAPTIEIDDTQYCFCQQPGVEGDILIGCDGENCQYEWFHLKCVGLDHPPTGTWYCSTCEELLKARKTIRKRGL